MMTLKASEVSEGEILEATSPSLFGDNRVIVITDCERAGKEVVDIILRACVNPAPGMSMVEVARWSGWRSLDGQGGGGR